MTPGLVISIVGGYFLVLIIISYFTSKNADTNVFFTANRQSPWFLVAFGMIGASLSGVTFISIPGEVANTQFAYFQIVLGYIIGYMVIIYVLLPLYYKMHLVTIYTFLKRRFGFWSYKTGAVFFLISRLIGASFRLFLVAIVLQLFLFDAWGIPFEITVILTILLIWIYTFKGGIKTIVWTDTLQTLFMLAAVCITIYIIGRDLNLSFSELTQTVVDSDYSQIFVWEWRPETSFYKQFLAGIFITICMTGLDQDMMQKNLTCRNLKDAQKNMFWFSITLVFVNLLFLSLGALLYIYAEANGIAIPTRTDQLYPMLARDFFSIVAGFAFLLGIIAAAYSSADSALTAMTTSFCVDILDFDHKPEPVKKKIRMMVHISMSFVMLIIIIVFQLIQDDSVITTLFRAAGYTYGPLLGLFAFGLSTKLQLRDLWVVPICILAPVFSYIFNVYSEQLLFGYRAGFEILLINGGLTYLGLMMIAKWKEPRFSGNLYAAQK
jgi:SSS family transporter